MSDKLGRYAEFTALFLDELLSALLFARPVLLSAPLFGLETLAPHVSLLVVAALALHCFNNHFAVLVESNLSVGGILRVLLAELPLDLLLRFLVRHYETSAQLALPLTLVLGDLVGHGDLRRLTPSMLLLLLLLVREVAS